jgi:ribonucleotide reductase beta subunit family protein with ferritin-like domain
METDILALAESHLQSVAHDLEQARSDFLENERKIIIELIYSQENVYEGTNPAFLSSVVLPPLLNERHKLQEKIHRLSEISEKIKQFLQEMSNPENLAAFKAYAESMLALK